MWFIYSINKRSFITLVFRAGVTGRGTSCVSCASWWISPRWPSRCWRPCWGWCSAPAASQQMSFSLKTQWRWEIFRDCFLKPTLKTPWALECFLLLCLAGGWLSPCWWLSASSWASPSPGHWPWSETWSGHQHLRHLPRHLWNKIRSL